jgi:hypothetical protein
VKNLMVIPLSGIILSIFIYGIYLKIVQLVLTMETDVNDSERKRMNP